MTEPELQDKVRELLLKLVKERRQVTWAEIVRTLCAGLDGEFSPQTEGYVGNQLVALLHEGKLDFWECYYMLPKDQPRTIDSDWDV